VNHLKKIAVFASGSGTNAENIIRHFSGSKTSTVALILTNNPKAGVIERAKNAGTPYVVFSRTDFYESDAVIKILQHHQVDFIVLAGFLWLVPQKLILAFENKIINIHPALLPCFGGKGLYGTHVHRAVIASRALLSGITIHYVNDKFDEGEIIFQAACHLSKDDTVETLASKIHELEYRYFPTVIEKVVNHG